jgi:Xaa-Pro aminopeptidase
MAIGADALANALAADEISTSAEDVRDIIAGVAAAPPAVDADTWMCLIADDPSPDLRAALTTALDAARQTAATTADDDTAGEPLDLLRAAFADRAINGFVVPRSDEYQNEYVPLSAERLAWVTGFTGSAGTAVILAERAALFVDGRYTLQAAQDVADKPIEVVPIADKSVEDWLAEELCADTRLGFDPRMHTRAGARRLAKACGKAGAELVPVASNPLDAAWSDQPPPPLSPVVAQEDRFAGRSAAAKCTGLADQLVEKHVAAMIITQPDSVAWLLNLRGGDVGFTPLPLSSAILHADASVDMFIDSRKLSPGLDRHLGNGVTIHAPDALTTVLEQLGQDGAKIQADAAAASEAVFQALAKGGATITEAADPCQLAKAVKNPVERDGTRAAHLRDGAALTRFLHWLATSAGAGEVGEIEAADRLEAFRATNDHFRGLSFPTISGAASNGAIVHYRVDEVSERKLEPGSFYLVDSGAQYLDGTTDVTRTVAIGAPSDEMRDRFTRVLKGHIAIATARFPVGTSGSQLDSLARLSLWQAGLDYDHGTGHGVGSYLGVHEGPHRISKGPVGTPLKPGMIVSNEPGYYKTGAYGIRIENLVEVVAVDRPEGGERDILGFNSLTLAPIDRNAIEPALLTAPETAWLDTYHATVREKLTPRLDPETAAWLAEVTAPLD